MSTDKETEFVTEADWIPDFWNFLLGLAPNDLIAELVQNDLDQQATRTVITFEQERLVAEGNGGPVDDAGWQRLRKIRGAGDLVPAKRGKIGVKNHGLKTAFTIGDQVDVLSDGCAITQTLYAHGIDKRPHPGASAEPKRHPDALSNGCRIVITYRTKDFIPSQGEAISFGAVTPELIDNLFKAACKTIPEQFAGIVSPEVAPEYEIVLRHWRLGDARFSFSCTRPRKMGKNIKMFRRRCAISGSADSLPHSLEEEAARQTRPLTGILKKRVPDFFQRKNRYFVEVSWPVNRRGKPLKGTGRFRYPIGYPESSGEAKTGHGVFFNAPFVSDTERHGPAWNESTTNELLASCEALLVEVMTRRLVPKWGAGGLDPLVPSPGADDQNIAVRRILAALAQRKAIPTLTWNEATKLLHGRTKLFAHAASHFAIRSKRRNPIPARYSFVLPMVKWNDISIHRALAVLCPREEKQIDPRIDSAIIRLLADRNTNGFSDTFITFDEDDALTRAKGEGNTFFDACSTRNETFANSLIARSHLDLIQDCLAEDELDSATVDDLLNELLLPDSRGKAVPFRDLHSSAPLPSDIPGLRLPPLLSQQLASHPLLRRKKWKRSKYTLTKFLEGGTLQGACEADRAKFWEWLRRNEKQIKPAERARLAEVEIWPDANGALCRLADLCEPRSKAVASALGASIRRPHDQVRRSRITKLGGNRSTSIRQVPTRDELHDGITSRIGAFQVGSKANAHTATAMERFELDLARLMKNPSIARLLAESSVVLPALARDHSVRWRTELVILTEAIERLELPPRFLLKTNRHSTVLNKLSPALAQPTVAMLVSAFEEDNANFGALQSRLRLFQGLTSDGDEHRSRVAKMPILPVDGQPRTPLELAFIGNKGDYWGDWKRRLSGKGLSQDDQRRYLRIGVTSATPNRETSLAFFKWLSMQDVNVLEQHIGCVLRHILYPNDPAAWAQIYADTPFIPVRCKDGLQLISLRMVQRKRAFLPDMGEITDRIIEADAKVFLTIDRVKGIRVPITQRLRDLGIPSLREAVGEPERVVGHGVIREAPKQLQERLRALRSSKLQNTLYKRLGQFGVESELVRRDWYNRISRIKEIKLSGDVEAIYMFRRKRYPIHTEAGFDPASGTLWIREGQRDAQDSFLETIAAQLVFKAGARPMHLLMLNQALELEISDPIYGRPRQAERNDGEDADDPENTMNGDVDTETGEAAFGHAPFDPDPKKNVPSPKPIPSVFAGRTRRRGRSKSQKKAIPTPAVEKEHMQRLKSEHYASHCQMCLCQRAPAELAPSGSYVEWEEVRRRVVEAHHVDPKSGGGARHAGNLILLCKFHHDNYGRRLTREAVIAALRGTTRDQTIIFDGGTKQTNIHGLVAATTIPDGVVA